MRNRWIQNSCILTLGMFLLASCKKDECKQQNYENENCYSQVECYNLSSEVVTQKLIGKWEVTEFEKDGKSIKKYIGDKLEFCCYEYAGVDNLCADGELKLKTNLLKKHKTTWIYKGWILNIGYGSDEFPDEYRTILSGSIEKLTTDEFKTIGSSNFVVLKKLK